ncbi:nicotinamidase [Syntrophotalea carbinolica DSM 2380]|uniref:nicotinamidase n=1 Tax=Syntrophotalea carbinolica (strain DSM 2380 / NBRC 103641 / GraBd1) TaxID=338963 RepID=Q3A4K0_SYNC1|nr:isochorismatase family protein [Syntrophotalea carbinolica]ABA88707.1 nicotinamidase [Syntrophotalea carbinolica DSM 2380]
MRNPEEFLQMGDGLLVVDVQRDFCPGGALPIPEGDKVVPVINAWAEAALKKHLPVYYSCDWHPEGHPSFKSHGGDWPKHCVQHTPGADFCADLFLAPASVVVVKGVRFDQDQLSVFDQTGFADKLRRDGVDRLWVAGLALDVCVLETVLDGVRSGFEVAVIVEGCRPVTPAGGQAALAAMKGADIYLLEEVDD